MWVRNKYAIKWKNCLIIIQLFFTQFVIAEEDTLNVVLNDNISSRWRIEGSILIGAGITDHEVGFTSENEPVLISGGGGIGGSLIIGYGLSRKLDLGFGVSIENSSLLPEVENASANFLRTALVSNLKYRIPISSLGFINFGCGIGFYIPGDLNLDMGAVSGGAHNIFKYDNSFGYQILGEYEGFFSEDFSWIIGLKYYQVSYKIRSAKSNDINIPLEELDQKLYEAIVNLDGSGVDLVISLNYYF